MHTWQCVYDSESYVRATAVTCVSKMLPIQLIWQSFMTEIQLTEVNFIYKTRYWIIEKQYSILYFSVTIVVIILIQPN